MNFRSRPMIDQSDPGTVVVGLVMSYIARLVGLLKYYHDGMCWRRIDEFLEAEWNGLAMNP